MICANGFYDSTMSDLKTPDRFINQAFENSEKHFASTQQFSMTLKLRLANPVFSFRSQK